MGSNKMQIKKWLVVILAWSLVCSTAFARSAPESFADLAEELLPTVVNISTTQTIDVADSDQLGELFTYRFPEGSPFNDLPELFDKFYSEQGKDKQPTDRKAMSLGSGFIIGEDGYIVTNNHVIEKADEIKIIFSDNTEATGKIVGRDVKTDIALLKVEVDHKLKAITWGDSDNVRVGDWVVAIGNPFGLGGSVSAGIISARARDINVGPFDDFLQTDAAINRGNSGGPLFNTEGEVVGINTAIFSPTGGNVGIGFSVPVALAKPVIDQLKDTGKVQRGWLGVKIQTVTKEIADSLGLSQEGGALVLEVNQGSPAKKSGILPGDVILTFDGKQVLEMRKLPRIVADTQIGKEVDVVIWRKGAKQKLSVMVAELEESDEPQANKLGLLPQKKNDASLLGKTTDILGMTVADLTTENKQYFKLNKQLVGVLVAKVNDQSAAAAGGIMPGDVIESINQEAITSVKAFSAQVAKAKQAKRKSVLLLINRRGATQFVVVNM